MGLTMVGWVSRSFQVCQGAQVDLQVFTGPSDCHLGAGSVFSRVEGSTGVARQSTHVQVKI